ncbi:hypothetical protein PG996_008842 [Apiospora saccharicola]|uniref:Glutathione S-transferase n=1 Tax=Apiospora saccharicola TaxID=335842 RepID=A0ABR1V1N7_9PEZI
MSDTKPTLHHLNKGRAPAELKKIHSRGRSPTLVTASGRVITERSAITLYLIRTYDPQGRFQVANPALPLPLSSSSASGAAAGGEDDLLREEELVSLGMATINPVIMFAYVLAVIAKMSPFFVRPIMAGFSMLMRKAFLDAELAGGFAELERRLLLPKKTAGTGTEEHAREYLMGGPEPTRADFMVAWFAEWAVAGKLVDLPKNYPATQAWLARCLARPAYKRSLEKGNGYNMDIDKY